MPSLRFRSRDGRNLTKAARLLGGAIAVAAVAGGCGGSGGGGRSANLHPDLIVADYNNNRVLAYKQPFSNGEAAHKVLGQTDFTSGLCNQDSSLGATTLCQPYSAATDRSGHGWVADSGNDRVLEFLPPFSNGMAASVVLGEPDFATDTGCGETTANGLCLPTSVAFDKHGNAWVADQGNCRVLEFTPPFSNGMAASLVLGQPDLSTGCSTTGGQNGMHSPEFLTFDKSGNLWVSDYYNDRVLEFTPPFSNAMNAALVLGQPDFTTYACNADANGECASEGVAFDSSGNLWLGDDGNCRALQYQPPFATNMNASVVLGQANLTDSCVITSGQAGLADAGGVGFDPTGHFYVSDFLNNRVMQFSAPFSNGMNASKVFGEPDFSTTTANTTQDGLHGPWGLSIGDTP